MKNEFQNPHYRGGGANFGQQRRERQVILELSESSRDNSSQANRIHSV